MKYVENNLMAGEKVTYSASIHWFVYAQGTLLVLTGLVLSVWLKVWNGAGIWIVANSYADTVMWGTVSGITFLGVYSLVKAFIARISIELAVTNRRTIVKTGFISRYTFELNHAGVESFHVDQGIVGRIFNFGTLSIHGRGGGMKPVGCVDSPLEFRKAAIQAVDVSLNH